jgi:hypothetical protein
MMARTAPSWISAALLAAVSMQAQDAPLGPSAHFSIIAQGQSGTDGDSLSVPAPSSGMVGVSMMSTSVQGTAPIAGYVWTANGAPVTGNGPTCTASLGEPVNSIALTVTDAGGMTSTAVASVILRRQTGPAAHFTMTILGRTAGDGQILAVAAPAGGTASASISSTSSEGGSPIVRYVWAVNGTPVACSGGACVTSLMAATNSISLVVTDSNGQSASASALIRFTNP